MRLLCSRIFPQSGILSMFASRRSNCTAILPHSLHCMPIQVIRLLSQLHKLRIAIRPHFSRFWQAGHNRQLRFRIRYLQVWRHLQLSMQQLRLQFQTELILLQVVLFWLPAQLLRIMHSIEIMHHWRLL